MYIEARNIMKSYGTENRVQVINNITCGIEEGQICAVVGPSGSGKSTFLNILGALDTLDSGTLTIGGKNLSTMNESERARFRRDTLGFVFQFYNLVPNLTVKENIQVCEYISEDALDIDELLETLGMTAQQQKFPWQLSGGQQQRCAIARALIKNPQLLLCDEPTGALDSTSARDILELLIHINERFNTTMVIVTHNTIITDLVHQVIEIRDGQIKRNLRNQTRISARDLRW